MLAALEETPAQVPGDVRCAHFSVDLFGYGSYVQATLCITDEGNPVRESRSIEPMSFRGSGTEEPD